MHNRFCSFPFHSTLIESVQGQTSMRPCCLYNQKLEYPTVKDFFNSNEMQSLRSEFKQDSNVLPNGCARCNHEEKLGINSYRINSAKTFEGHYNVNNPELKFVDLDIGYVCNMSCYMCLPHVSSGLAAEHKALGWINEVRKIDDQTHILNALYNLPSTVESINFTNGEFFLEKVADKILDFCIERNIRISFSTNASYLRDDQLEKLYRCKTAIAVSIDGTEDLYNIMRYPSSWQQFNEVFLKLKSVPKKEYFVLRFVAQNLNIFGLIPVLKFGYKHKINTTVSLVHNNLWLLWSALPDSDRHNLSIHLQKDLDQNQKFLTKAHSAMIQNYIDSINTTNYNKKHAGILIDKISKIWAYRNTDYNLYQSIYPEFYSLVSQQVKLIRGAV